tara:strand:- start:137 stop:583 length:447 start_codon:yes stop_codon:yes gene_type:complete
MRKDEFVMRGQTESGQTEVLNFSGFKPGYAYRLVEFELYASTALGTGVNELCGSISAGKTAISPTNPNFNDDALIATSYTANNTNVGYSYADSIVNDTFLITQNLILMVQETSGNDYPVNWQCKFMPVKMAKAEEAVANYKQFMISDS